MLRRFRLRHFRSSFVLAAFASLFFVGCRREKTQNPPSPPPRVERPDFAPTSRPNAARDSNDGNLLLGNPSDAKKAPNNFLLQRPQYDMSYNRSRGSANWVSWHVDNQDLGDVSRGRFRPDPLLPDDWQIKPGDYRGSGFDRGHLVPSADRDASREDNNATFFMSNMAPQTPELNQHVWADLENAVRDEVRKNREAYQIAGCTGEKGRIAENRVSVPDSCWKIVVFLPEGENDLKRITPQTEVWAVSMPNSPDKKLRDADWRDYRTSVRELENTTNWRFFTALPERVRRALLAEGQ